MNVLLTGCAAIALYVAVTVRTSGHVNRNGALLPPLSLTGGLAGLALVAHAANLYPMAVTPAGLNLGVFTAASLIAWLVSLSTLVVACNRPVVSLAVVVLPFSALVIGASLLFSNQNLVPQSPGLALHIACSLVAYSLFVIAAVQAGYLAFAERQLRRHTPVLRFLPPLPVMESMMFQLVGVAFALLTIGLATGAVHIVDVRGQHLSHKIVFSVLAWSTFGALLYGRLRHRWRGRRAVKYVIVGVVFLALGFFGSKIALELILERT